MTENFEQKAGGERWVRPPGAKFEYSREVKEIAFRAAEMVEFKNIVNQSKSKLEALKAVRELLPGHFPEINEIPEPKIESKGLLGPASNEFMIAKHIVDLLWKN